MAGGTILYESIKTAANITDRVLVGISGGKDSAVTLDLCKKYFKHVTGFFLYLVQGLSFQESILNYYSRRYDIEIIRAPHFMLSEWLRYGSFRLPDLDVKITSTKETYDYLREKTNIYWIAGGERISDSIVRRAMIKHSGTIDSARGRFYPIAYWCKADIMHYIKFAKLKLGTDSNKLGFSFRSLMPFELSQIKKHYPEDYERIKVWFPLVETSIKQGEFFPEKYGGQ